MSRLSLARSLLLALLGLTLVLALVAGLSVASLYQARQDYEDELAGSYAAEVAAANLIAAGVVEGAVLGSRRTRDIDRRRAAAAFDAAATAAIQAAGDDRASRALVGRIRRAQTAARASGGQVGRALSDAREAAARLAARQAVRRTQARERVSDRTRRATTSAAVAGGLALLAALALVGVLVAGLRRPLSDLVRATRRLAGGDLDARVEPAGPPELRELSGAFNAMADELRTARERVEAGRRRLAYVIESLGDALVITGPDANVVEVNPRAAELVPELRPGRPAGEPLPALEAALAGEVSVSHGSRVLAVTASRMQPDGVVWTIRDTTERARLEHAKSEFVATASHELRSPLTSIKGFVELLAAGDLDEREREYVDVILLSTNRLVDLVNDLLDVARVEAGHLEIRRRPISVAEAVKEVVALMRPRIAEKDQRLRIDVAAALPHADADPARVRQIVTNLLTNAHLYTPQGGELAVRVGASADHVVFSLSDTGRGMSQRDLDRLFERFHRGEHPPGAPGTGLGMSIVKALVDLHGGEIDVESEEGRGTTVTVRLPRAPTDGRGDSRDALRGRRVLVVDDDAEIARLVASQLRAYDVDVGVASSVQTALEQLRTDAFDAMTLDILLGETSGFELLSIMRDDPDLRGIPVIVVSVLAGQGALAGEWSVTKPIDADELAEALGAAILAGRARVLVVAREEIAPQLVPLLEERGLDYTWASSATDAARLCEEHRFEVALVDAGIRSPQAALTALHLRGRRRRRSVVVFSTGGDAPGLARLEPDPVPLEDAARAVLAALAEPGDG